MSRIAPEVWTNLEAARPQGEALTARLAVPEVTSRLKAALDADGMRHLLVYLSPGDVELRDTESRGLVVQTRQLLVSNEPPARFLDMTCQDVAGRSAFDLIGAELADALTVEACQPAEAVSRVLARWRRFWGHLPRQILSRQEQLGLFAELWFFAVWLAPRCGAPAAALRWRGPYGARHDFEWQGSSVEIKATAVVGSRVHHINGLEQLAPPEQGLLYLFSLQVRDEAGATNNLPILVERCRTLFVNEPDALGRWEAALSTAGYSPAHDEEYAKLRLRIINESLFTVRDDFPRLTLANLSAGLPPAISGITYDIHLDGFGHLQVREESAITTVLS